MITVIVTLLWAGSVSYYFRRGSPPEPEVILWNDDYYDPDPQVSAEIGDAHRRLKLILPEVNFDGMPFGEAVNQLDNSMHAAFPHLQPGIFRIAENVPLDTPINLKFTDVPVGEALRYLTALNSCHYEVQAGGVIQITDLETPLETASIEGWFAISPEFFYGIDVTKQSEPLRKMLEDLGINLSPTDSVEYYPDRFLLRATTSRENLELIDTFVSSYQICPTPGWREHLTEWWYQTKIKLGLASAPVPATPPPVLAPDPFGG
jgi:hypothetical protein